MEDVTEQEKDKKHVSKCTFHLVRALTEPVRRNRDFAFKDPAPFVWSPMSLC
jgi:transcription initiation factor IIF auxiliary subunit